MAAGIRRNFPQAVVDCCPIGDGGEGTLDALAASITIDSVSCAVMGLDGRSVEAQIGYFDDNETAYIESAHCVGLQLVPPADRDIMKATTFGVGELILQAAQSGARRIIVGVGGSASNDGGCGMAQAVGIRFLDAEHQVLSSPIGGGILSQIAAVDTSNLSPLLQDTSITVLCDVNNPLVGINGAAKTFAAQKGASVKQIATLENGMQSLAAVVKRDLSVNIGALPGAGAAGGLAAGLIVFANASTQSGIDFVIDQTDLTQRIIECDLCLTGEGRIDGQSLSGKACLGVAALAAASGVPTIALVGSTGPGARRCLDAGLKKIVVIGEQLSQNESMARCAELLATAAAIEAGHLA